MPSPLLKEADGSLTVLSSSSARTAMTGNHRTKASLSFSTTDHKSCSTTKTQKLYSSCDLIYVFLKNYFLPVIRSVLDSLWNYSTTESHSLNTQKNLLLDPPNILLTHTHTICHSLLSLLPFLPNSPINSFLIWTSKGTLWTSWPCNLPYSTLVF